jgi:hypothetical protein
MQYHEFMDSLAHDTCPAGLDPCLRALWYDARGDWESAHAIVQEQRGAPAARIHLSGRSDPGGGMGEAGA